METPKNPVDYMDIKVDRDTILTFSYTSGTTGQPKGSLLSHGNFLSALGAFLNHDMKGFSPKDVYLSFLPLPHIFERTAIATLYVCCSFIV